MYSSDLYSQGDIASILPPYEIEPNGINVAGEEVVCNSSKMETNALGAVTRNYALLGEEGNHSDKSRVSSSRMDLKVSVVRKVNTEKTNTWFPKKVLIVTDKRRIKSMAWAHSSNDLITCPSSSEITYPIENDSRSELTMDSDPSLSSINAPSWYSSQSSTSPSTSSASTTTGFQLNSISIEPDIESGSLRSSNPPLDPSRNEEGGKELNNAARFGIEVQQFHVPLKVYPRSSRFSSCFS
ncbi:hypothetical protein Q1695_003259 [Nippostrongylus brasiliensis]|nr:hypothetical protein Q1695_003259 [Nippostrongylus brasiliensis]